MKRKNLVIKIIAITTFLVVSLGVGVVFGRGRIVDEGKMYQVASYQIAKNLLNHYQGSVIVTPRTKQELNQYVNSVHSDLEKLLNKNGPLEVQVTITFSSLLSSAEFWSLIDKYQIKPVTCYVRGYDGNGDRITGYGDSYNKETLDELINFVSEDIEGQPGIISTYGSVVLDSNTFKEIIADNRIFCFDGITELVEDDLKDTIRNIQFKETNNLFWYVEDFIL